MSAAASAATAGKETKTSLRPEDVLADTKPRPGFVVPPSANWCGLDFVKFRVWDHENPDRVLLDFERPASCVMPPPQERPSHFRVLRYTLDASFFEAPRLSSLFADHHTRNTMHTNRSGKLTTQGDGGGDRTGPCSTWAAAAQTARATWSSCRRSG